MMENGEENSPDRLYQEERTGHVYSIGYHFGHKQGMLG